MLIDLEQPPATLETSSDVCILGGGIAGLLLAERLAECGLRVHLLEAGGLTQEDRSQQFYDAEMAAERHTGTHEGRFRTYGGSSTRWGGQLLPYTEDIFQPPPGAPSLSWPLDPRELEPYYAPLQKKLGVDLLPFDSSLLPALHHPQLAFSSDIRLRFSKWIPFARRNLAKTVGETVRTHPNATVFTHANVAEIIASNGQANTVGVLNYSGREFSFTAARFVLATGTVESSRLLLLSPTIPNPHDQMGRYFHDHLSWRAATFSGNSRAHILERLGPFLVKGTLHTAKLEAGGALRAREKLLAVMAHVTIAEPEDSGTAAVRNLLQSLQRGHLRQAIQKNLLPMLRGTADLARLAFDATVRKRRAVSKRATVALHIDLEQTPSPENRIALSDERDALALRKARVIWRVSDEERDTALRFAPIIENELAQLGLAPDPPPTGARSLQPELLDTFHPMGGLRMGTDARESVVDTNLRVHGVGNLYVASCAVFPAGGSSNPTFTLMALALRLADQLAEATPHSPHQ